MTDTTLFAQNAYCNGIDLGTTNSEVAALRDGVIHVFRNAEGSEYTPSAVWINRQGNLVTGREAKEWHERDPENAFIEFKRDMGTSTEYHFTRSGRRLKPEELSAEMLKSLRGDVQRQTGEAITAAVVTVPADFELPQCEATKRAAQLAGFTHCMLIQEPVAAALAYSFDHEDDKALWLVYDFGGGTFDAALIQVRDGVIQVMNHEGDNHLGGKNLDWALVEGLFIPALTRERPLTDFRRGNPKWRGAVAKLKIQAEAAKIRLASAVSTEILIDFLCNDDRGEPVEFQFTLQRSDLQRLATPLIQRTVNICRNVLTQRHLTPSHVSKLILVGGPTLMPCLREQLLDPAEGLGIPLEFSVDPLTVVARGAAVFAANQQLPHDAKTAPPVAAGEFGIRLDYNAVGPDIEPPIAGTVAAGGAEDADFTGFTLEFLNETSQPAWRSGKVPLSSKGAFLTSLSAVKGKTNTFRIELRDAAGAAQRITPNAFTITVKGPLVDNPPLIHSVGVALANNDVALFFEKGTPLPTRKTQTLRTALSLQKGQSGQLLRVPVLEGERPRADRNRVIGTLLIPAERITRDVPLGSEIEVTIEIDKSRLIRTRAFIPILGENGDFEDVLPLESATPDPTELSKRLVSSRDRLAKARVKAKTTGDARAAAALQRIDSESMVQASENAVSAASGDQDAARQSNNLLNDLDSAIDDAESALEWPALVAEAEKELAQAKRYIADSKDATTEDRQALAGLERDIRTAIEQRSTDLLRRRVQQVSALVADVLLRSPGPWIAFLEELKKDRAKMRDPELANRLFQQADQAVAGNNFPSLKEAVRGLLGLLPRGERPAGIGDVML